MNAAGTDADTSHDVAIVGGGLVGAPLALALDALGCRVALLERRDGPVHVPDDPLAQRCTALSAGSVRWFDAHGLWSALAPGACPIRQVHVSHRGRFGATRLTAAEQGVEALGHVVENRRVLAALDARLDASGVVRLGGRDVVAIEPGADVSRVHHVPVAAASGTARGSDGGGTGSRAAGTNTSASASASAGTTVSAGADTDRNTGSDRDTAADTGANTSANAEASLRARLVIGVDGIDSAVRTALGIGTRRHDYRQSAVLGTLRLERDHGNVAYERFTDGGPLALLPRPDRAVSFVECVTPADGARLAELDDAAYLAHLQSRFGRRLGRFVAIGPRDVLPLARTEATRQVGPRAVLLGNAARLLHPIAGQGYNLALRDVAALIGAIAGDAAGAGVIDPGDPARLAAFAASRRSDQRRVVALTDTLARVFRGRSATLSHLRALGLVGLDTVAPLRRRFARAAMGVDG